MTRKTDKKSKLASAVADLAEAHRELEVADAAILFWIWAAGAGWFLFCLASVALLAGSAS